MRHDPAVTADLPELPPGAFGKPDSSPDARFYAAPRFVTHIDDGAIAAVTALYRDLFPPGGAILDLMSSWVTHLPDDVTYREVAGLGMNAAELDANPRLSRRAVRDLNADPSLPFGDAAFDGAGLCVSIQYLQRPVPVLREVARVLRPGAPLVITFSNRCFPTKAVAIWSALGHAERVRLVSLFLERACFATLETLAPVPPGRGGDPLWAVVGRSPAR